MFLINNILPLSLSFHWLGKTIRNPQKPKSHRRSFLCRYSGFCQFFILTGLVERRALALCCVKENKDNVAS